MPHFSVFIDLIVFFEGCITFWRTLWTIFSWVFVPLFIFFLKDFFFFFLKLPLLLWQALLLLLQACGIGFQSLNGEKKRTLMKITMGYILQPFQRMINVYKVMSIRDFWQSPSRCFPDKMITFLEAFHVLAEVILLIFSI